VAETHLAGEFAEVAVNPSLVSHQKRDFLVDRHVNHLLQLLGLVRDRLFGEDRFLCGECCLYFTVPVMWWW
jgi:hypothetical protein